MMHSITHSIQDIEYIIQTYKDFYNDIKQSSQKFTEYQKCMSELDNFAPVILDVLTNKLFLNLIHKVGDTDITGEDIKNSKQFICAQQLMKILKELQPTESAQNKQFRSIMLGIDENEKELEPFLLKNLVEMANEDVENDSKYHQVDQHD